MPAFRRLLGDCVVRGEIDVVPGGWWVERMMADFDWENGARFVDGEGGPVAGVLLIERTLASGSLLRVEVAATETHRLRLAAWGLAAARLRGVRLAQTWRARGAGGWLAEAGFELVRPFWRMDRADLASVPEPGIPAGYRLLDDSGSVPPETWAAAVNEAFAEHWRNSPMRPEDFKRRHTRKERIPGLDLLLMDGDGAPAAVVLSSVDDPTSDRRRQPVGLVSVVGTHPAHRRRGLASVLVAEALRRLRSAGAASSSLYVDGENPTRAQDVYRGLGYEVGFEFEVWEATLA